MSFNIPETNDSSEISTGVINQIHIDGANVKVMPAGTPPSVVYRVGDGTVHPEGWDNIDGQRYVDFYLSTGFTGAKGEQGNDGLSAYSQAVAGGYEGTEEEFYGLLGEVNDNAILADVSATQAQGYATDAQNSATASASSEANSLLYSQNSATSATNSSASAASSEASATASQNSASASSTSASEASNSATSASGSASNALASETNASIHKTNAQTSATEAQASASSASASALSAEASALEASLYVGKPTTDAPTLTGDATVNENNDLVVTITNYSPTASYTIVTTSGTANRVDGVITISAGAVESDTASSLTVTAQEASHLVSNDGIHNFTVINCLVLNDTDYEINVSGALFNDSNYPTSAYGNTDNSLDSEGELSFDAVTYTGNGTTQDIVTGVSSVDFTVSGNGSGYWLDRTVNQVKTDVGDVVASGSCEVNTSKVHVKCRTVAHHNFEVDGLRGVSNWIATNLTNAETTDIGIVGSFNADGFTVAEDNVNRVSETYIAYQTLYTHIKWGTTNQSKFYIEAYNPLTGEGMVYYVGSGTAGHEIPHSQGGILSYVDIKSLESTQSWVSGIDDKIGNLDTTIAFISSVNHWNFFASNVTFTVSQASTNAASAEYIMYYKANSQTQAIGTYTGTGTAGNFVPTFDSEGNPRKPRRVIFKRLDNVSDWWVHDSARDLDGIQDSIIALNTSNAESANSTYDVVFTSSGFILNTTLSPWNNSGSQMLYIVEFDTKAEQTPSGSYAWDTATYSSTTVTKADAEGNWNGTQEGYIKSRLNNIISSADATNVILEGNQVDEVLYLGDGTDLETVTATGATYLDPTDTTGRTAKYLFNGDVTDELNTYDGTPTDITYTSGLFGQSAVFNGTSCRLPTNSSITSQNFSMSFWMSSNVLSTFTGTMTLGYSDRAFTAGKGFALFATNGNFAIQTMTGASAGSSDTYAIDSSLDSGFHHYVLTKTDSSSWRLYIDGVLSYTSPTRTVIFPTVNTASGLFYNRDVNNNEFNGIADQVEIYNNVVLSQSDITDLYNTGKTKFTHGQSFTPTFACSKDNVDVKVAFDGTNYNTLTKGTATLEADAVVPNTANDEFETVLYAGNGTSQTVSTTNISAPIDFSWIKSRTEGATLYTGNHQLFDSIRGVTNRLFSNLTNAESVDVNSLTAFGSGSFDVGSGSTVNYNGHNFVAWCASLPNHTASNTAGTITSETKANSFMSAVSYTGDGTNKTAGHGLDKTPELIIDKLRTGTSNWNVFFPASGDYMRLNLTDGATTASAPATSTTLTTTSWTGDVIAYAFTSVEGLCKVGSYTGTGVAGNVVECGFEPAWLMVKETSGTGSWNITDGKRANDGYRLFADAAQAEDVSNDMCDYTTNGFTLNNNGSSTNDVGQTYIYLAIAKNSPEDLHIRETLNASGVVANTGTSLKHEVTHKEQDTETTEIFVGLTEEG